MRGPMVMCTVLCLMLATPVAAEDLLRVSHRILDLTETESGTLVTLELTVTNQGDRDLHNLTFSAADLPVVSLERAHLGQLPILGTNIVIFSVDTPWSPAYFQATQPLAFLIEGKTQSGSRIAIPAVSVGGGL